MPSNSSHDLGGGTLDDAIVGIRILSEAALSEIRNLLRQKTAVSKEIADAAAPAT
jgi:hypothetical protein